MSKLVFGLVLVSVFLGLYSAHVFAELDPAVVAAQKAKLEAELKVYEDQIAGFQSLILEKQKEGNSFKRDIDILNAQIAKAKLAIKARTLSINKLLGGIEDKSKNIVVLNTDMESARASLAQFLRKIHESDGFSAVELALAYQDLSQFFGELESLQNIQESLQNTFAKFNDLRDREQKAKEDLQEQKNEETKLKTLQELEQKRAQANEKEKSKLLTDTKGKESEYQKILKDKQKTAANIRSQLFLLTGSPSISFEKAIEYANLAERATGIRPAFLLGIITQETNLGANIGQCLLTNNPNKGDGKGKNTGTFFKALMKPTRDVDPYLRITSALGLDPMQMPVSCSQAGGYGGAMGPAQFIPSTWVGIESRVAKATGSNPPNPWNAKDGFAAAALYLTDLGASSQTYNAEWTAAMKFFAGSNWQKTAYRFYGDDVMAIAKKYQDQITLLQSLAQR
ncbi:MAG: lytic murein transglycosylase [bacterium]|nr:lytic murein transglycosylase [bacterium]